MSGLLRKTAEHVLLGFDDFCIVFLGDTMESVGGF